MPEITHECVFKISKEDPKLKDVFQHKASFSIDSAIDFLNNIFSIELHLHPRKKIMINETTASDRYMHFAIKYDTTDGTVRRTVKQILTKLNTSIEEHATLILPPKPKPLTEKELIERKKIKLMISIREKLPSLTVKTLNQIMRVIESEPTSKF